MRRWKDLPDLPAVRFSARSSSRLPYDRTSHNNKSRPYPSADGHKR